MSDSRVLRVGSVSYLNAKPLIYGLEEEKDLELLLDVPSRLLGGLEKGEFDVALLPVIDYQRLGGLRIVTSGGIGSDGPTLTVRIFSRVPVEQIKRLACDTDSHTSVALARVVLGELYGNRPEFVELGSEGSATCEARLLIGDKVIAQEPRGFEHQIDLGGAWKELTGLPFVFAVWTARGGVDLRDLPRRLERARRDGLEHVEQIVERQAAVRRWPREIAMQYLTRYLCFDIGPRQLEAIALFHRLAAKYGLIGAVRPLEIYSNS